MGKKFDVAVIGGGPAGCSTALRLARLGFRCLVVEKSDYSNVRVGETLPPAIRKLLVDLGVWDRFLAAGYAPAFAIRSTWGSRQVRERDAIFDAYGAGWHIDRGHFDRMFAELVETDGVRTLRGARVDSFTAVNDGFWRLEIDWSGRPHGACARVLVDASGRRSAIARRLGAKRITMDRLIGCVAFFRPTSPEIVKPQVMLVEAARDGWWYSAPLPDERVVVVYMTDADLFAKLEGPLMSRLAELIGRAPLTAERLEHFDLDHGPSVSAANSSRLDRVWGDNWIAVGDSTMAFDPLSSQGVYRAVKSGLRAAEAIAGFCSKDTEALAAYAAELSSEFDQYMLQRRHHYSMETRWATKDFWRRRHAPGST
jgi:flavin-dependent dehydrogenase